MNNEMKKDALTDEELNKVSGGAWTPFDPGKIDLSGLVVDRTIPDYCTPINVTDGGNGSVLCPYDGKVLKNADHSPSFAPYGWLFKCPECNKWFTKVSKDNWYVSDRDPM